jgi:hypothetical protein
MHFGASVQYGDWKGEAKADTIDPPLADIQKLLQKTGKSKSDDFIIGISVWVGENKSNTSLAPVVTVLAIPAASFKEAEKYLTGRKPVKVRETKLKLSFDEFFGLFKRFSIALGHSGLNVLKLSYKTARR